MREWLFVYSDVRRGGASLSSVMLGEGVVDCLQRCEDNGWFFVFNDVRWGDGSFSSVVLGEGWLFVFRDVR